MSKNEAATREKHLRCNRCEDFVTVARDDLVARLVCHCTHVDGEIEGIPLSRAAGDRSLPLHTRWYFA